MTCAEIVHMRMVLKEQNKYVTISIATNGGIGSPAQYQRLGQLGVNIIFGVDGASTETLQLHRVNVNFDRVIENAKAYPSKLAKTVDNKWTPVTPQWQFLLFNENKHDLLPALKIAKTLGFKIFNIRKLNGLSDPNYPLFQYMILLLRIYTLAYTREESEIPKNIWGWHFIGARIRQDKDPIHTKEYTKD